MSAPVEAFQGKETFKGGRLKGYTSLSFVRKHIHRKACQGSHILTLDKGSLPVSQTFLRDPPFSGQYLLTERISESSIVKRYNRGLYLQANTIQSQGYTRTTVYMNVITGFNISPAHKRMCVNTTHKS